MPGTIQLWVSTVPGEVECKDEHSPPMKVLRRHIALHPQSRLNVWVLYIELDFGRSDTGEYIRWEPELEVGNGG